MAQRRMFSLKIVDSDAFLDMGQGSQLLYFHLAMRGDDDGFVGNPKKIMRIIGASEDDMKILLAKRFLIAFDSGVVVIKHWPVHNLIRSDRYNETEYKTEKAALSLNENGAYTDRKAEPLPLRQPNGNQMAPQVRLGKDSIGKDKEENAVDESTRTPTPKQEAVQYFKDMEGLMSGERNKLGDWFEDRAHALGVEKSMIWSEARKFYIYWTEKNKSGTKQRWETEKTWEWKRRMATWFNRVGMDLQKQQKRGKGIIGVTE